MRFALLIILLAPTLCAMDGESSRFARRILLNEEARKHTGVEVGDLTALTGCELFKADFDGDGTPDTAALMRRDLKLVLAFFPGRVEADAPKGIRCWTATEAVGAALLKLQMQVCIRCETVHESNDMESATRRTDWQLWRWHKDAWCEAMTITAALVRSSGGGRVVHQRTCIVSDKPRLELVETSRDLLDGKELEGSGVRRTAPIAVDASGKFVAGAFAGAEVPIATRTQLARTLERTGLLAPALEQAEKAVAQAERENLKPDDARLLDARSLHMRLQSRLPAAVASK